MLKSNINIMIRLFSEQVILLSIITIPIWFIARCIIIVKRKKKNEKISIKREIILDIFFVYIIIVLALTIVPMHITPGLRRPGIRDINIIPVVGTVNCMIHTPHNMTNDMIKFWLENILGNLFLLMPLGMLLPILCKEFRSFKQMTSLAFFCSLSIEIIQFFSTFIGSFRTCDIDDVILNTIGAAIGYLIFSKIINKNSPNNLEKCGKL